MRFPLHRCDHNCSSKRSLEQRLVWLGFVLVWLGLFHQFRALRERRFVNIILCQVYHHGSGWPPILPPCSCCHCIAPDDCFNTSLYIDQPWVASSRDIEWAPQERRFVNTDVRQFRAPLELCENGGLLTSFCAKFTIMILVDHQYYLPALVASSLLLMIPLIRVCSSISHEWHLRVI